MNNTLNPSVIVGHTNNDQTNFRKAMLFLFEVEGGLSDDVHDYGGLTKYGISQRRYSHIDIVNLTKEEAISIYYADYWLKMHCTIIKEPLATVMFDTGVNCGVRTTCKWLQKVCNTKGSTLAVDGLIGIKTISELDKYNTAFLMSGVIGHRLQRYSDIVKRDPSQERFFRGWINRVANLLFYVL